MAYNPMADNPPLVASSSSTIAASQLSFAEDPRAFYDKESGTWRLEDDDGNELEYDLTKRAWVPVVRKLSTYICRPPSSWGRASDQMWFSSRMTC